MLRSIDSCQNRVSTDQYHLTISLAQVSLPLTLRVFWRYPVISYKFSIDRKLKYKWISLPCYNFIVWSKLQIYWRELRSFLESELRLWEGSCSISGVYYRGPNTHESTLNCPMYCSNYYPIKHRVFPEETKFSKVWTRDLSLRIGADPFFSFLCIFLFLSEISDCPKWPFSAFETDPHTSTATGVALLFVFHKFFIFLARSWYRSCFSISFCMNNITGPRICNLHINRLPRVRFCELQCPVSADDFLDDFEL